MALKDHVTDSSKLSEEEIESIITDLLKYDPVHKAIVFLPKSQDLSGEKKVLLYLVALRGWKFLVAENTPPGDASPKEIEQATGVLGGTLRPMLRGLVQAKILADRKGRYEIPAHNLGRVRDAMANPNRAVSYQIKPEKKVKNGRSEKESKISSKKSGSGKPSLAESFQKLLDDKWFGQGKTLAHLKEKLDEMTVFPPITHLPVHLLKAYRNSLLKRSKQVIDGKSVWVYSQD